MTGSVRARGADFSSWQSVAATRAAIAQGLDFGIVKLTEGTGYVNPLARRQFDLLRQAGAVVGVYHFLRPGDGAAQWDYFEEELRVKTFQVDLVACDYEAAGVTDRVARAFIRRGQQRGFKVGLYGSSGVSSRRLGQDWTWAAWWNPTPPPYRWDVWQFSGSGGQDWNVYHGDVAALRAFAERMGARRRPTSRWWISDRSAGRALGPYRLARVGPALVAYALRHPRSSHYAVERK